MLTDAVSPARARFRLSVPVVAEQQRVGGDAGPEAGAEVRAAQLGAEADAAVVADLALEEAAYRVLSADAELLARDQRVAAVLAIPGEPQLEPRRQGQRVGGRPAQQAVVGVGARTRGLEIGAPAMRTAGDVGHDAAADVDLLALAGPGGGIAEARRVDGDIGEQVGIAADDPDAVVEGAVLEAVAQSLPQRCGRLQVLLVAQAGHLAAPAHVEQLADDARVDIGIHREQVERVAERRQGHAVVDGRDADASRVLGRGDVLAGEHVAGAGDVGVLEEDAGAQAAGVRGAGVVEHGADLPRLLVLDRDRRIDAAGAVALQVDAEPARRILVGQADLRRQRVGVRRRLPPQRRQAGTDARGVEVAVALDGDDAQGRLAHRDADHTVGDALFGQRHLHGAEAVPHIGSLQRLDRRARSGERSVGSAVRRERGIDGLGRQDAVALDDEAADLEHRFGRARLGRRVGGERRQTHAGNRAEQRGHAGHAAHARRDERDRGDERGKAGRRRLARLQPGRERPRGPDQSHRQRAAPETGCGMHGSTAPKGACSQ